MTLAAALTAWAEFLGDTLVNDCGQPVPSRVLRYHGGPPPEDYGCGNGYLAVWWQAGLGPKERTQQCTGPLTVTLGAKWMVCWKIAKADSKGVTLFDDQWDTDTARLADAAECVARALTRLTCPPPPSTPAALALFATMRQTSLRLVNVDPGRPSGGAASVTWQMSGDLLAPSPGAS